MNAQPRAGSNQNQDQDAQTSKLSFPQVTLENCIPIAQAIYRVGGDECTWDQLAAYLQLAPKSGNFRAKMLSTKRFGLLTYASGMVQLTPLGRRTLNVEKDRDLLVEAFFSVPIFKDLYDHFQGMPVPPNEAIEGKLSTLGLPKTQTKRARQTFLSSAQYAGFRDLAPDRMVLPVSSSQRILDEPVIEDKEETIEKQVNESVEINPLIMGLLNNMPKENESWPIDQFIIWLKTLQLNLAVIYGQPDLGTIEILQPKKELSL